MALMTGLARLGRDAEVRYTPQGKAVSNLSLAFSYGMKDDQGKRPTQWVDASLWGERAEKLADYLVKGQLLSVVLDEVRVETYEMREGGTGHKLAARVVGVEFAGPPPDSAGGQQQGRAPAPASSGYGRTPAPAPRQQGRAPAPADGWPEDDIPF